MNFLLPSNKKVYFASDLHLTTSTDEESRRRELDFVQWLDKVKIDAAAIFLLGDFFDFWFEYRYVIPRGFVRLLGKLAELTDSGIPIHYFTGNHDQWMRDYLTKESNIKIYRKPAEFEINEKLFLIGHGHGNNISPENKFYKLIYVAFENRLLQRLFAALHPRWGMNLGTNWSIYSRKRRGISKPFIGVENELIYCYTKNVLTKKHYDFFVFGHRHLALDIPLNENSRYINTGEWIEAKSYAVFDGEKITLHSARATTI